MCSLPSLLLVMDKQFIDPMKPMVIWLNEIYKEKLQKQ